MPKSWLTSVGWIEGFLSCEPGNLVVHKILFPLAVKTLSLLVMALISGSMSGANVGRQYRRKTEVSDRRCFRITVSVQWPVVMLRVIKYISVVYRIFSNVYICLAKAFNNAKTFIHLIWNRISN